MNDGWPAWALERVEIVDHDPAWSGLATEFAAEVTQALDGQLVGEVEHVGSTAVSGLPAKPVMDLQACVDDLDAAPGVVGERLHSAGWEYVSPELDQQPWRRFFVKVTSDGQHRLAHLHLMRVGEIEFQRQRRFRDALRSDRQLMLDYAALKKALAARHAGDRSAYTDGKSDFVARALQGHQESDRA